LIRLESIVKSLAELLGIDKAIGFNLARGGWNAFSGFITIYLVARYLDPYMQGYYYTFYSLVALQVFIEMGLGFALIQFISHEMAHLSWSENKTVEGGEDVKRRLQSLVQFGYSWLGIGGLILSVTLIPFGLYMFGDGKLTLNGLQDYGYAWILLVLGTGVSLQITATSIALEGCGKVADVIFIRLVQSIFSTLILWACLSSGLSLYSLGISLLAGILCSGYLIYFKHRKFLINLLFSFKSIEKKVDWRRELLPFQWRIALSWVSGYFIFQAITPILFKYSSPSIAGQFGASMQFFLLLNAGALTWISTKMPLFGMLISQKKIDELNKIFFKNLIRSSLILFGALTFFIIAYCLMMEKESEILERFLSPIPLLILAFVCLTNHIVFSMALYLRANKEEPFLIISIGNALLTIILAFILVPRYGGLGSVLSYAAGSILIGLIGGIYIFNLKKYE